jgi:hypothetical protein
MSGTTTTKRKTGADLGRPTAQIVLCEARLQVLDLMEELGSAAGLLREACGDEAAGNATGVQMCADDVVGMMATIECKASQIGASLMRLVEG